MGLQIFGLKCPECGKTNSRQGKTPDINICNNCSHIFKDTHPITTIEQVAIDFAKISAKMEELFPFNKVFP